MSAALPEMPAAAYSSGMAASFRRVPVLALAAFASVTQSFVFAGMLSGMAADLSVSVAAAGQLATVYALAFAVSAPFVAAWAARFPRRGVIASGLALLGAINLLLMASGSYGALLAWRVLAGIASGAVVPTAMAAATMLVPPAQRGRAIATVMAGTTLAFLLGIPLGSVVGEWLGWRASFGFAGLLALAVAAAIRLVLPRLPGEAGGPAGGLRVLARAGVPGTLAATLLGFTAVFSVAAYVGPAVEAVAGFSPTGVALMQALVGVASLLGIPVGARLADSGRVGLALLLPLGVAAGHLGQAWLLWAMADASPPAIMLQGGFILLTAACMFALSPVISARLVVLAPDARSVVLAANSSSVFLGQAAGAAAGGAAILLLGLPGIGLAGATAAFACFLLLLQIARRG
ncbi:MAG: MFS transporter [Acetobacteraceae bacterium]|nr:MFS transporter [Acetobacteraceae bacterium]